MLSCLLSVPVYIAFHIIGMAILASLGTAIFLIFYFYFYFFQFFLFPSLGDHRIAEAVRGSPGGHTHPVPHPCVPKISPRRITHAIQLKCTQAPIVFE